jgi:hypothetical protein
MTDPEVDPASREATLERLLVILTESGFRAVLVSLAEEIETWSDACRSQGWWPKDSDAADFVRLVATGKGSTLPSME